VANLAQQPPLTSSPGDAEAMSWKIRATFEAQRKRNADWDNRAVSLEDLGVRICIMGPSNSGKSTLAVAIGQAKGLPVIHLDQYRHTPGTQWKLRPDSEFAELHDLAINQEQWVIEGNYSQLVAQRLAQATGLILLDASSGVSVVRYLRRTSIPHKRVGGLEGTRDRVSWGMIRYILGVGQTNRRRYRELFEEISLPKVFLPNRGARERFYRDEILREQ
jgi:adenylate kinase family enzyme